MTIRIARLAGTSAVLALWCLAVATDPADAQRLAYRLAGPTTSYGVVDVATGTSTAATADEAQLYSVFTSDGQYAVRVETAGALLVRHMPSGQQTQVSSDFVPWFAHPRQHTFFGTSGGFPARLDARGLVRWTSCGAAPAFAPAMDLALDGRTLFVSCANGDLVGLDTETGAEVRRIVALGYSRIAVNATATEVVLARGVNGLFGVFDLLRLDLVTGQTLTTRRITNALGAPHVVATPDHQRIVLGTWVMAGPELYFGQTIIEGTSLAPANVGLMPGTIVDLSPDGREAFVVANGYGGATAAWVDVATGALLAATSVGPGYTLALDYEPAPLPPVLAPAQAAPGSVTLSWVLPDASPMANSYVLEVGDRPGAANLASTALGPVGTVSGTGVPPGRYFVRMRAVNVNGTSRPSNEIVVDVPAASQ